MKIKITDYTPNPETKISEIASICHKIEPNENIIKVILKLKHYSVLEHAFITFKIEDISRTCTHQLVRHRVGVSFTQESQRYVEINKDYFVMPKTITQEYQKIKFDNICNHLIEDYKELIKFGIPKEDARFILPQGIKTSLYVTFNYRSLLHFYSERACMKSQWEINEIAEEMKELIKPIAPIIYENMVPRCLTLNIKCKNKLCKYNKQMENTI